MRQDLPAVQKAYDLAKELLPRVGKFPKEYRFNLGDRVISSSLAVLENLTVAAYSRDKAVLLNEASMALERLRFLLRLSCELGPISKNGYEHVVKMVDDLGRQIGGWSRQAKDKNGKNAQEPLPADR